MTLNSTVSGLGLGFLAKICVLLCSAAPLQRGAGDGARARSNQREQGSCLAHATDEAVVDESCAKGGRAAERSGATPNASLDLELSSLLAAALAIVLEHEAHLVALADRGNAGRFERGGMDEHVLATGLRRDEAKALGSVEELHSTTHSHWEVLSRSEFSRPTGPAARRASKSGKTDKREA